MGQAGSPNAIFSVRYTAWSGRPHGTTLRLPWFDRACLLSLRKFQLQLPVAGGRNESLDGATRTRGVALL